MLSLPLACQLTEDPIVNAMKATAEAVSSAAHVCFFFIVNAFLKAILYDLFVARLNLITSQENWSLEKGLVSFAGFM